MSHNGTLPALANWYLNVGATYGWLLVLPATVITFVAAWCSLGLLFGGGSR